MSAPTPFEGLEVNDRKNHAWCFLVAARRFMPPNPRRGVSCALTNHHLMCCQAAPIRKYAGAAAVLALVGGVAGVMAVISNGASSSSSSSSSVATQMELETVSYDDFAIEVRLAC